MRMRFKDGKRKVLTLSYDDGFVQDIRMVEVLNKYGIKATFNINSGMFLKEDAERKVFDGKLKLSEALELYLPSGHEIAAHTVNHIYPRNVDKMELMYEILEDRKALENNFNSFVRGFAHPFSIYNEEIRGILELGRYSYARGGVSSYSFELPENRFCLQPTCRHRDVRLMELTEKFVNGNPRGELYFFLLMGHSHEFDGDNNWEVLEGFCDAVAGREDIWYATNIEIFDYIDAYDSLKITSDSKIIHNPSVMDVWIEHKGKILRIPAGETVEV